MSTIKDRVRIVLEGSPILSSIIQKGWPLHGWTHEAGGIDEISVEGLDGLLDDYQKAGWINEYLIDLTGLDTGDVLVFNGTNWVPGSGAGVSSINALQGDIILLEGDGISITDDSSTDITITNTGVLSLSTDADEQVTGHVKLLGGSNIVIDPLLAGDGFVVNAIVSEVPYYPAALTVVGGTLNSGTVDQLQSWADDAWIDIQEVSGTPGYDLRFKFEDVLVGFDKLVIYFLYYGAGASHSVHVQIYNYSTAGWTDLGEFSLSSAWTVKEYPIPDDTNYKNGSGESIVRIYHDDAGITSHYIYVNYMALIRSAPGGSTAGVLSFGESGDTAQVGNITISEGANVTITRTGTNFEIAAQTSGGVTDHGLLSGLPDDDHLQYFRTDGTRLATGNFDMGDHGITNVTYLDFVMGEVANAEGRMWWNDDDGTVNLGLKGGVSVLQVGQEMPFRCYNDTGTAIADGRLVYVNGFTADNPHIALASNDASDAAYVFGMATESIADSHYGYSTTSGLVRGLNTSSYSAGQILWLGTAGNLVTAQPDAPARSVAAGGVVRVHATEGSFYMRPTVIPRLTHLSDVNVRDTGMDDHQTLIWDDANSRFDAVNLNLQTVYEGGKSIDLNSALGSVYIHNTTDYDGGAGDMDVERVLTLSSLNTTSSGTERMINILNNATTASERHTIQFEGGAGVGATNLAGYGHQLDTLNGCLSITATLNENPSVETAFFKVTNQLFDSTNRAVARMGAIQDSGYNSYVQVDATGDVILNADYSLQMFSDANMYAYGDANIQFYPGYVAGSGGYMLIHRDDPQASLNPLLMLDNDDADGGCPTIKFTGTAGTGAPYVWGDRLLTDGGALTMIADHATEVNTSATSFVSVRLKDVNETDATSVALQADGGAGGEYAALQLWAHETASQVYIDANEMHIIAGRSFPQATPTISGGLISATYGTPHQKITVTDSDLDISTNSVSDISVSFGFSMTGKTAGPLILEVWASGSDIDFGSNAMSDIQWAGSLNPSSSTVTIPEDGFIVVSMSWIGSQMTATVIPQAA